MKTEINAVNVAINPSRGTIFASVVSTTRRRLGRIVDVEYADTRGRKVTVRFKRKFSTVVREAMASS